MIDREVELLAPAGEFKAFYSSINSGADSVYLGGKKFGARASSENFDEEDLKYAVKYAHNKDVKVYVTVNTIIKDSEMIDAINYCIYLAKIGVDAAIVQDYGLMYLINAFVPELKVNVSTQSAVYDEYGVNFFDFNNINKIILAREVSLKDIKKIKENTNIPLEAFIHGALCNSYSGQCYLSSFLGGRSGNRGKCAQPCRLNYSFVDDGNSVINKDREKPLLSLKDYKVGDSIEDMIDAGISTLKIEGRMKSFVYTAAVVQYYRSLIDKYSGKNVDDLYLKEVEENMSEVFSRGYTDSYLMKNNSNIDSMYAMTSSGTRGDRIDELTKKYFDLSKPFSKARRKIIDFQFYAEADKKIALFANCENNEVCVLSEELCEGSLGVITTKKKIEEQLTKLGDSYYSIGQIDINIGDEIFIKKSTLNKLRRDAVMQIFELLNEKSENEDLKYLKSTKISKIFAEEKNEDIESKSVDELYAPKISVKINDIAELNFIDEYKVDRIYLPISLEFKNIEKYSEKLTSIKERYLYLPNIMNENLYKMASNIIEGNNFINGLCVNNSGSIEYFYGKFDLPIHIGYFLNVINSYAMLGYKEKGISSMTFSVESNINDMKSILGNYNFNTEVVAHAHVKLMSMKNCPFSTLSNCNYKENCGECIYNNGYKLKDRMNKDFYFEREYGVSGMYNCLPLSVLGKINEFKKLNIAYYMLDTKFLYDAETVIDAIYDELNSEEDIEINDDENIGINTIEGKKKKFKLKNNTFTRGHYFKSLL